MRICMLLHKSVEHDSRVRREAKSLAAAGHDVTVVHLPADRHAEALQIDGFTVVCATPAPWLRRALPLRVYRVAFLAGFVRAALRAQPDVVHAHDAPMLAPGLLAARLARAKLVYDSHELATGVPYRERLWARFVAALERIALPRCAAVITVSDGIADRLQALYRLRARPVVLRNVPDTEGSGDGVAGMRERLGIGSAPLVLHQGALAPRRGCEALVDALALVPGAHLVFLGDPWPGYDGVIERAVSDAGIEDRVHFVPSAPVQDLLRYTREADVGVSLLSDDCENHRLALPNKVFEYIAAGVPVIVSDLPEIRRLVHEHGIGWAIEASDRSQLARALSGALADENGRTAALTRAAGELRWDNEQERLLDLYQQFGAATAPLRALVFVRNAVTYDARVLREGRVLQELGFDTTVVGVVTASEREPNAVLTGIRVARLAPGTRPARWGGRRKRPPMAASTGQSATGSEDPVSTRARPRRTIRRLLVTLDWYRRGMGVLRRARPTLVHCNDYNTMWIGVAAKLGGARVIYDSHELWPDRNLRPEPRLWLLLCEAVFVRAADQVITTSPGYADVLERRYRIPRPLVVRNAPEAIELQPGGNVGSLAVYFGAITRNRGLEQAIDALVDVPELRLRIIGPEAWGFRSVLARRAAERGVDARVEILDPVAPAEAGSALAGADVGLALIQPVCLSYELTLPNKLLEYACAGLPILATDLPVMADFLREHELGLTVEPGNPDDLTAKLRAMLEPDANERFRAAARRARAELTWTAERGLLVDTYSGIA